MKETPMKISLICLALMLTFALSAPAYAQHICNDGSYCSSDGSGTCSHHGGESDDGN
jgi:hypothetical protein